MEELVPIILVEDEAKVKSIISWEAKLDTLLGFCGLQVDHACVTALKPVIGSDSRNYGMIMQAFSTHRITKIVRVRILNPLHDKLPRLVLVVTCTCICFDALWVHNQWDKIDQLSSNECAQVVGPILGHALDTDSCHKLLMLSCYRLTTS